MRQELASDALIHGTIVSVEDRVRRLRRYLIGIQVVAVWSNRKLWMKDQRLKKRIALRQPPRRASARRLPPWGEHLHQQEVVEPALARAVFHIAHEGVFRQGRCKHLDLHRVMKLERSPPDEARIAPRSSNPAGY